jgi:hypothetical protein
VLAPADAEKLTTADRRTAAATAIEMNTGQKNLPGTDNASLTPLR